MPLMNKIAKFATSPQGRRLFGKAKTYAQSPKGRAKIEQVQRQLAARRSGRHQAALGRSRGRRAAASRCSPPSRSSRSSFQVTASVRRSRGRCQSSRVAAEPVAAVAPHRAAPRTSPAPARGRRPPRSRRGGSASSRAARPALRTRPSNSSCPQRASEGMSPASAPAAAKVAGVRAVGQERAAVARVDRRGAAVRVPVGVRARRPRAARPAGTRGRRRRGGRTRRRRSAAASGSPRGALEDVAQRSRSRRWSRPPRSVAPASERGEQRAPARAARPGRARPAGRARPTCGRAGRGSSRGRRRASAGYQRTTGSSRRSRPSSTSRIASAADRDLRDAVERERRCPASSAAAA